MSIKYSKTLNSHKRPLILIKNFKTKNLNKHKNYNSDGTFSA